MFVHDDQKDPKCGHARYSSRYPKTSKPEKINPGQLKYFCKRFHISPKGCKRISGRTQDDATLLKVAHRIRPALASAYYGSQNKGGGGQ